MGQWLCLAALMAAGTGERGWYSDERLAVMRQNLAEHDWARAQRDAIVKRASAFLDWTPERLRALVPPPEVPRAIIVHDTGCPIHGAKVNAIGRYSWKVSPAEPWKIRCPVGGEAYPSNDFGAYLAGGMKDRSLLTGDYADDGWGWRKPGAEKKFWFVAYYAHWLAHNHLLPALRDLSQAYLLTDDLRYAQATAVLLRQLADYYPDYFYEKQSRYGTEFNPRYLGRLLYHTWECFTVQAVAPAFDAVQPALAEADRAVIEERLLRTMARDIMDGSNRVQGNYGMHQIGLVQLALGLRGKPGEPGSEAMLDWVLHNDRATQYTGIGLEDALYNLVQRDGYPFESPGYNVAWNRDLNAVAEALAASGVDLYGNPRLRKLLHWPLALLTAGEFTPASGDSNNMFGLATGVTGDVGGAAFAAYGTPEWAVALKQVGATPEHDLFKKPLDEQLAAAAASHSEPAGLDSGLLPAAGFARLQVADETNRAAAVLYFGKYIGHRHYDRLQLDLFAHRNSLLPDFGYPETADYYDPRRPGFFEHTVSHNTVMIDARKQTDAPGRLHLFDAGEHAQVVEASAEDTYPGVAGLYRRTLVLVEAAPGQVYLVDIFRVRGGKQHDYLLHGTQSELSTDLPLTARPGTLAGEEVPYGNFYDDPALRDKEVGTVNYGSYQGSGFQFLFNIRRGPRTAPATVTWRLTRPEDVYPKRPTAGVALRAHLLGEADEVIVADGKPQQRTGWPETVPFVIRRRTGEALESTFVTVFEPHREEPFIRSVRSLTVSGEGAPVALEIETAAGRQVVVCRLDGQGAVSTATSTGELRTDARITVLAGGAEPWSYLVDGKAASWEGRSVTGQPALTASITDVDYAKRTIGLDRPLPAVLPAYAVAAPEGHAAALAPCERVDATTFGVGDDDLTAGRYTVVGVEGATAKVNPPFVYFVRPGMTVIDEEGKVVGRVASLSGNQITLAGAWPTSVVGRKVRFVVVGPGDPVIFHGSARAR